MTNVGTVVGSCHEKFPHFSGAGTFSDSRGAVAASCGNHAPKQLNRERSGPAERAKFGQGFCNVIVCS